MVDWLFNQGYKRIAFINGPDKILASKERLNGYIEAMSKKKIKVDMRLVEKTDLTKESTQAAMKKLLALKNPPNAIISFNDYVHMDAVQYAEKNGIKVNRDIVFVSYANLPITAYTAYPPMASLEQYPHVQGEKAMQLMIKLLNKKTTEDNAVEYLQEQLDAKLVIHRQ